MHAFSIQTSRHAEISSDVQRFLTVLPDNPAEVRVPGSCNGKLPVGSRTILGNSLALFQMPSRAELRCHGDEVFTYLSDDRLDGLEFHCL